jgi:hypothetical protein
MRIRGHREKEGNDMKTKGKIMAWALVAALAAFAIPTMALAGTGGTSSSTAAGNTSPATVASTADVSSSAADVAASAWNQICGNTNCPGYVDADGDGVCDNCGAVNGVGNAGCPGYVDEDGDGVCDNRGNGCGYGVGAGNGNAYRHGNGVGCGGCCAG